MHTGRRLSHLYKIHVSLRKVYELVGIPFCAVYRMTQSLLNVEKGHTHTCIVWLYPSEEMIVKEAPTLRNPAKQTLLERRGYCRPVQETVNDEFRNWRMSSSLKQPFISPTLYIVSNNQSGPRSKPDMELCDAGAVQQHSMSKQVESSLLWHYLGMFCWTRRAAY